MNKQNELEQEQTHLADCLSVIRQNVKYYEEEYAIRHKETTRLWKAMRNGDTELYNQAMTSASLEQHAEAQLHKNQTALRQPFFGRIDYVETPKVSVGGVKKPEKSTAGQAKREKKQVVYIGKNGIVRDQTDVVIADWRAPISTVYYENELGKGSYFLPDGQEISICLELKRTFDIQNGELKGYYDSDIASNDQLLIQYLSQNKEAVLGDIIATIQKEQMRIIRESPFANLLVQGVAGSGKTTVAMHRISYILYNYKERFQANEFCIIGGNDLLLEYITSGLPELDVPKMKQKRMDQMLAHLLGREWNKKYTLIPVTQDAKIRCQMDFMLDLEWYLMRYREKYYTQSSLRDGELGTILTQSSIERLFIEHPDFSIARLLRVLDERVKTRIKFLSPDGEKEFVQRKCRQYKDYYKNRTPKSIYEIYCHFLKEYEKAHAGRLDLEEHLKHAEEKQYDIYDLAALVIIRYRTTSLKEDEEFGQLFIDEAQDFGITPYYVLRRVLPKCFFTIMGDVSQNINYETGMNDWKDMKKWVLTGEKDVFYTLSKSYRNTIEISEFAGRLLEKASFGRYKTEPVIRHGIPVQVIEPMPETQMYDKAAEIIASAEKKGFQSIAVICKNEQEAGWVGRWLENVTILPVALTKGLEFDVVILWNPDLEGAKTDVRKAKLWYVAVTRALHELYLLSENFRHCLDN